MGNNQGTNPQDTWLGSQSSMERGTGMVQPAASLPLMARQAGAVVIEVNPQPSLITEDALAIVLKQGHKSRDKLIRIDGLTEEEARGRLVQAT